MANPDIATSHSKRISYASYPTSPVTENTVEFFFRRGDVKQFDVVTLQDRHTAKTIVEKKLNALSRSQNRVILLNDDTRVDMPEVSLDGLQHLLEEETVLGNGREKQVFVIVFDRDPTEDTLPQSRGSLDLPTTASGMKPRRGRGRRCVVL